MNKVRNKTPQFGSLLVRATWVVPGDRGPVGVDSGFRGAAILSSPYPTEVGTAVFETQG